MPHNKLAILVGPSSQVLGAYFDHSLLDTARELLDERGIPYDEYTITPNTLPPSEIAPVEPGCPDCEIGWLISNADPTVGALGEIERCDICRSLSVRKALHLAAAVGFVLGEYGAVLDTSQVTCPDSCYACGSPIATGGPLCPGCGYPYAPRPPAPACVVLDELGPFDCILLPQRWNGFACPLFTREAGMLIMKALSTLPDIVEATYDAAGDAFVIRREDDPDPEIFPATESGLYGIGAMCWVWTLPLES